MAELADATDLKSVVLLDVWVQVPLQVLSLDFRIGAFYLALSEDLKISLKEAHSIL